MGNGITEDPKKANTNKREYFDIISHLNHVQRTVVRIVINNTSEMVRYRMMVPPNEKKRTNASVKETANSKN